MKFNKIVIWGLRKKWHTHRFIHKAFYDNAKKLGYKVIWIEDEKENQKYIQANDLIISADPIGKMVPEKFTFEEYNLPARDDVYYCLHHFKEIFVEKLPKDKLIFLQFYKNEVEKIPSIEKWSTSTYFDKNTKTLYQAWGTDLLFEEFKKPVFRKNKFVFWIGSVWNDKLNHGNVNQIAGLKNVLKTLGLKFIHLRFIPNWLNIFFIRLSRIAPAIAGEQQVKVDYLPCRVFKNISYGQLGITNIKKFKDILGDTFIEGETIYDLIKNCLSLSEDEYIKLVEKQQEMIKYYTYKTSLENIFRSFDNIN